MKRKFQYANHRSMKEYLGGLEIVSLGEFLYFPRLTAAGSCLANQTRGIQV